MSPAGGAAGGASGDAAADALPLVVVYADESCLGNGREAEGAPGAAGGVIEYRRPDTGEIVRRDFWLSEARTTNNRMAIRSAIEPFTALARRGQRFRVLFRSDSQYLVKGMSEWVHGWLRKGWRKSDGLPVENKELWVQALTAWGDGGHLVNFEWVRGHDGHAQNEYANHLATRAAARQDASNGLVTSEFTEWMVGARAKRTVKRDAEPFPTTVAGFRAAPGLPRTAVGSP
jgi:ribonuclease HI